MDHAHSPTCLYMLRGVVGGEIDWPQMHRAAIATGSGELTGRSEERVAAVDELLTMSLRTLVVLGELAAYASFPPLVEDCRRPLVRTTAGLVRLLDRALQAHGRDVGYDTDAWRGDVAIYASAAAVALEDPDEEIAPLPITLQRSAGLIADALTALTRDRVGVPELLAHAAGELLLIYAAAS